jgi:hypothetical protein
MALLVLLPEPFLFQVHISLHLALAEQLVLQVVEVREAVVVVAPLVEQMVYAQTARH